MNKIDEMKNVLVEIYEGYGVSDESGISYFKKFSSRLTGFDDVHIVKYLMNFYSNRFVLDFILSSSSLCSNISATIWVDILNSSDLRIDASRTNDEVAQYADIEFLSRYVGVDALGYLIDAGKGSKNDKRHALAYFSKSPYALIPSELDDEDMDGIYFVRKEELVSLQATLRADFGFWRIGCTEESVQEYIDVLNDKFHLQYQ